MHKTCIATRRSWGGFATRIINNKIKYSAVTLMPSRQVPNILLVAVIQGHYEAEHEIINAPFSQTMTSLINRFTGYEQYERVRK